MTITQHPVEAMESSTYVQVRKMDIGNYIISMQSIFRGANQQNYHSFPSAFILIAYNRATKRSDTLKVEDMADFMPGDTEKIRVRDVTRDIRFDKLALIIDWEGSSDHWTSELIGYVDDTLRTIYSGGIEELKRKDQWTLTGFSDGEEEITRHQFDNFPLTISLKTFEGEVKTPDTLVTNFETEATDTVHAWRIFKTGGHAPYNILPGEKFTIDTVLPASQTAIMHMDSVILRATSDKLFQHIKVSDAG